ncbi:MAG TPA: carboxypeptidase-like regulatory domain-containing protein, partial [Pyrinomonadaceae bacterium]|nr:carboxypeptidase-like regulatory domain-containing protein [Pyrinomonadaceae bacterium]
MIYRTLFLLVLTLLLALTVVAQTHRATVRGTISDINGAAIPDVRVTLTNESTGESRKTMSLAQGDYAFTSLTPGVYELKGEKSGFTVYSERFELLVNEVVRRDVTLQVGGPETSSIDSLFNINLKKDSPSLGTVIENRQVTGLPLDGRNFYELSLLVPGTVPPAQGSAGSVRGDFAFSVNGAREDANNFLLDGVYNIDPKLNTFGVRPSVDAIKEFE